MSSNDFRELVDRYVSEKCSAEDILLLSELLEKQEYVDLLDQIMEEQLVANRSTFADFPEVVNRVRQNVMDNISVEQKPSGLRYMILRRWVAAAAVLLLISTAALVWLLPGKRVHNDTAHIITNTVIEPGKDGAILTLDDGSQVVLDSLGNGVIAVQKGTRVALENGRVVYKANQAAGNELVYNTMTTPKGRQFRLQLQDGTLVWLNAASSIRYPIAFAGDERKVEVTGEVYFEVAKDAKKPFRVMVSDETSIEVLGTHFNINSYKNEESIKTTLLEGSVRLVNGKEMAILKPGQQGQTYAQVNNNETRQRIRVVNDVDLDKVVAWKNGLFNFQDASLEEVMGQLERWYDIDVVYEKGVPDLEFIGKMGRDLTLDEVLRGLRLSEVHFRIEGRKLIVMP